MLTWVTQVAPLLPDWALRSLDAVIKDAMFCPGECRPLTLLRDLSAGPLKEVPKITNSTRTTPSGPVKVVDIVSVVAQAFGIPDVRPLLLSPLKLLPAQTLFCIA